MNNNNTGNPFLELIGEQLSSVTFVQDYLQLDFDGFVISFYDWPFINISNEKYTFQEESYRNKLCSFISEIVLDVIFEDDLIFRIIFASKNAIGLDLQNKNQELLFYTGPDDKWGSI